MKMTGYNWVQALERLENGKRHMNHLFLKLMKNEKGFGINELLGIAAAIIIAAFIIIPKLTDFAESVMLGLDQWWGNINIKIFPTSSP